MTKKLIGKIKKLKSNKVGQLVKQRMQELERNFESEHSVFSELCFCITTANSSAEMGLKVQEALGGRLEGYDNNSLAEKLRSLGYRFYNKRAEYLIEARQNWQNIKEIVSEFKDENIAREWLVENILGFGYKEASHFLRNVGYKNIAILDRHVLRVMHEHAMIKELPKTLTRKKYLEYEKKLEMICKATQLSQGELDFYLWYLKTGRVLK